MLQDKLKIFPTLATVGYDAHALIYMEYLDRGGYYIENYNKPLDEYKYILCDANRDINASNVVLMDKILYFEKESFRDTITIYDGFKNKFPQLATSERIDKLVDKSSVLENGIFIHTTRFVEDILGYESNESIEVENICQDIVCCRYNSLISWYWKNHSSNIELFNKIEKIISEDNYDLFAKDIFYLLLASNKCHLDLFKPRIKNIPEGILFTKIKQLVLEYQLLN